MTEETRSTAEDATLSDAELAELQRKGVEHGLGPLDVRDLFGHLAELKTLHSHAQATPLEAQDPTGVEAALEVCAAYGGGTAAMVLRRHIAALTAKLDAAAAQLHADHRAVHEALGWAHDWHGRTLPTPWRGVTALISERDEAKRMHAANVEAGCALAAEFDKAGVGSALDGVLTRARVLLSERAAFRQRAGDRDEVARIIADNLETGATPGIIAECLEEYLAGPREDATGAAVDPMHPNGRCTCAGEGTCEWCSRLRCVGCGREKVDLCAACESEAMQGQDATASPMSTGAETAAERVQRLEREHSGARLVGGMDASPELSTAAPGPGTDHEWDGSPVDRAEPSTETTAERLLREERAAQVDEVRRAAEPSTAGACDCSRPKDHPPEADCYPMGMCGPVPIAFDAVCILPKGHEGPHDDGTDTDEVRPAAKPSTAEAFATVRLELGYGAQDDAFAALALLERRMVAMGRALVLGERMRNVFQRLSQDEGEGQRLTPGTRESMADTMREWDAVAALTDAPPVFTLEEVRSVAAEVMKEASAAAEAEENAEDDEAKFSALGRAEGARAVVEGLAASRK